MRIRQIFTGRRFVLLGIILLLAILVASTLFSRVAESNYRTFSFVRLTVSVPKTFELDNTKSPTNDGVLAIKDSDGGQITITGLPAPINGGTSLESMKYNSTHSATGELKDISASTFKLGDSQVLHIDSSKVKNGIYDELFVFTKRRTIALTINGHTSKVLNQSVRDHIIDNLSLEGTN